MSDCRLSSDQSKAVVRRSFIITTVREQRPKSRHKGATGRVCHCQLGQDIKKNGSLTVCSADLGSDKLSEAESSSSWLCLRTSFSLPCINPQALIRTVSWNRWKSCLRLDMPSFLVIAYMKQKTFCTELWVSAYGILKEGQTSSGLSSAFLWLARMVGQN